MSSRPRSPGALAGALALLLATGAWPASAAEDPSDHDAPPADVEDDRGVAAAWVDNLRPLQGGGTRRALFELWTVALMVQSAPAVALGAYVVFAGTNAPYLEGLVVASAVGAGAFAPAAAGGLWLAGVLLAAYAGVPPDRVAARVVWGVPGVALGLLATALLWVGAVGLYLQLSPPSPPWDRIAVGPTVLATAAGCLLVGGVAYAVAPLATALLVGVGEVLDESGAPPVVPPGPLTTNAIGE